jgi:hypothetical protein
MRENNNTGRTLWDFLHENRFIFLFLSFIILGIFGLAIAKDYNLKFPFFSLESPQKDINNEKNEKTIIKPKPQPSNPSSVKSSNIENIPKNAQKKFNVSGLVYDEKGNPLANVIISVSGINTTVISDNHGRFEFYFQHLPPKGEYSINYAKNGYKSKNYTYYELPKVISETLVLE